jgi:putative transposase
MKKSEYNPELHHRRSIRLKGHDYAGDGLYFVTICAHREFIEWAGGKPFAGAAIMPPERMPPIRGIMEEEMQKTAHLLPWMEWGEWVIMPDHFHAIIKIEGGQGCLGDVITGFKAGVTRTLRARGDILVARNGEPAPEKMRIWHRNYYEMIVRSAEAEQQISEYIRMNPWKCVTPFENGLRGIGNPALWNAKKLGVLCSRNAPRIGRIPNADVYFGGWHSPKEKEILEWLLEKRKRVVACFAWDVESAGTAPGVAYALQENRILILEMQNREGDLAAAEQRNRFVIENSDDLFVPHTPSGVMLDKILK